MLWNVWNVTSSRRTVRCHVSIARSPGDDEAVVTHDEALEPVPSHVEALEAIVTHFEALVAPLRPTAHALMRRSRHH